MSAKFAAAIAIFAAVPAFAQAPDHGKVPKPSKEEVQRLVQNIQADQAKLQQYCQMMMFYEQAAQAQEKKQKKKYRDLTRKAENTGKKLGPEYQMAMAGIQQMDALSPEYDELMSLTQPLDKSCEEASKKK
jgi:DNA repair ATPase RecN